MASHGTTGPLDDAGGNQAGAAPGFVDLAGQGFGPAAGSPLLGAAATLPAELAAYALDRQYLRHQATAARADAGRTVGAFAPGGGGWPGTTPGTTAPPGGCGCSGGGPPLALLAVLAARARRARR